MRAKGLLSVVMTGAMMMGVLSGCGFEPDITWTDTADGSESSYKVTVVVAHDGKLNIKSEQTVKDGDTLNFIATPSKDGDHRITGLMVDGVRQTYTGELPLEGEVKISLENINQDMTVVVLCDNETGGLGGVDGVVTGLEGDGSGSNGSSSTGNDDKHENDDSEDTQTISLTVENHDNRGTVGIDFFGADGTKEEDEIGNAQEGEKTELAVEEDSTLTLDIDADNGWEVASITVDGNLVTLAEGTDLDDFEIGLELASYIETGAEHTVEVTYKRETYSISIAEGIANGNAYVVSDGNSVQYEGNASVRLLPNIGYKIGTVTATVEDPDSKATTEYNTFDIAKVRDGAVYTLKNVKGPVKFEVSFEAADVKKVEIKSNSSLINKEYVVGEQVDISNLGLEAVITYDDDRTETVPLDNTNAGIAVYKEGQVPVQSDTFTTPGTYQIKVTYKGKGATENASCTINNITVTYLSQADNAQIDENFKCLAGELQVPVVTDENLISWLKSGDVNPKKGYQYIKLFFNLKNEEQRVVRIEKEMSSFFMNDVDEKKDQYTDVQVYWYMNEDTGFFTMYVIFKN